MALEDAIYTALSTATGMAAIVSTRIYPVQAPQSVAYPCIIYTILSEHDEGVAMGADGGNYRSRVQVDIYAAKLGEAAGALAIRDLVRTALKRLRNATIKDCFEENGGFRSFVTDPDLYRITMDYTVRH